MAQVPPLQPPLLLLLYPMLMRSCCSSRWLSWRVRRRERLLPFWADGPPPSTPRALSPSSSRFRRTPKTSATAGVRSLPISASMSPLTYPFLVVRLARRSFGFFNQHKKRCALCLDWLCNACVMPRIPLHLVSKVDQPLSAKSVPMLDTCEDCTRIAFAYVRHGLPLAPTVLAPPGLTCYKTHTTGACGTGPSWLKEIATHFRMCIE